MAVARAVALCCWGFACYGFVRCRSQDLNFSGFWFVADRWVSRIEIERETVYTHAHACISTWSRTNSASTRCPRALGGHSASTWGG